MTTAEKLTRNTPESSVKQWYQEPWPWLLMLGPFIVIVAGITTAWLAVSSSDGLVTEDYYKQGLAAGETIAKSQLAESLGITAGISMTREEIRVALRAENTIDMPKSLQVTLSHPTKAGMDQQTLLIRDGDAYHGQMSLPASGHWLVMVEDAAKTWRLMGSLVLPTDKEMVIGGAVSAKPGK